MPTTYADDITLLQTRLRHWHARNFPHAEPWEPGLGLSEEVGEVNRCILKAAQGIRGTQEEWDQKLYEEMGDVMIYLAHIANLKGFNLNDIFHDRVDTVTERDWIADKQGHGLPE